MNATSHTSHPLSCPSAGHRSLRYNGTHIDTPPSTKRSPNRRSGERSPVRARDGSTLILGPPSLHWGVRRNQLSDFVESAPRSDAWHFSVVFGVLVRAYVISEPSSRAVWQYHYCVVAFGVGIAFERIYCDDKSSLKFRRTRALQRTTGPLCRIVAFRFTHGFLSAQRYCRPVVAELGRSQKLISRVRS